MSEKVGRNDPCPCGSGKKYKQCCLKTQQESSASKGLRKFTAKIISAGGAHKQQQQEEEASEKEAAMMSQAAIDYNTLMERSFGKAIHSQDEQPPLPNDPSQYMEKDSS